MELGKDLTSLRKGILYDASANRIIEPGLYYFKIHFLREGDRGLNIYPVYLHSYNGDMPHQNNACCQTEWGLVSAADKEQRGVFKSEKRAWSRGHREPTTFLRRVLFKVFLMRRYGGDQFTINKPTLVPFSCPSILVMT